MNRNRIHGVLVLGALFLLVASSVDAGSVFLRNGYIIQGNIVEKDDDKVVIGVHGANTTLFIA